MGLRKKPQMVEAVLFFDEQGRVSKQMMFTEFEAMLDGVVNISEFADRQLRVAYVLITPRLLIKSVVFFCLDFDEDGAPDRGWNIPLQSLVEKAGPGPDLGAGPIRLVSHSRCPLPSYQLYLWEPELETQHDQLVQLRDAVKRNSLGLLIEEQAHTAHVSEQTASTLDASRVRADREQHMKNAELLKQQRQLLNTLTQQHEDELSKLKAQAQQQAQAQHNQIAALQQSLDQQQADNAALQSQLAELQAQAAAQAASFQASRQEMGEQLRSLEQDARTEADNLRIQLDGEWQAKLGQVLAQHAEQVAILDIELTYLHEHDGLNQQEIKRLTEANAELVTQGGLRYLEHLTELGVMFVVYHPGAGHLTIPLHEIVPYLGNPMAYAASKCFVGEEQYRQWLEHYQEPSCSALLSSGERCAIPLDRVELPGRFASGESNCCSRHTANGRMRSTA